MGDPAASRRLLMGRIGAAHGIRGEVRITPYTAEPMALAGYGVFDTSVPGLTIRIVSARPSGTVLVARLAGIADRNAAEKLNGVELYLDRDKLPATDDEDDFYHADLIGLVVRLTDGTEIGAVTAILNHGAGDILEVRNPRSGETFLYPFTRQVVPQVVLSDGYLVIAPPIETDPGEEEPN